MIRFQTNYMLFITVAFAFVVVFQDYVEGKPWGEIDRRKRIIAQVGPGLNFGGLNNRIDNDDDIDRRKRSYPTIPVMDNGISEHEYDFDRDARRASYENNNYKTTFPPFPGDDDDYDRYITTEETWRTTPTTEKATNYNNFNNEFGNENKDESQSWRKTVVPWFKRHWGRAKDYLKEQFNSASSQIG